ncbi:MAG TPA: FtsX-like permease family protein [Propionicimonas sp.]|uniref:ABC transporter permease n=1 Tax=Propionicimonas sp. TaxID=1955623 RepID=UPI002F415CD7
MWMLLLKMWRDVLARKGQFAGLIVVVGLGISTFVAFQAGYLDLTRSVERASRELKFADFSITVTGVASTKVAAVAAVPGVLAVEGRLVEDVPLEVDEESSQTAVARVVGLPNTGRPLVNDLLLLSGGWPRRGGAEALLHTKFAQETGARAGDELTILMGRNHKHVRVVGTAASPEYMYAVPEKGSLPSPREFAVLFMRADDAERLLGRPGTITDVAVIVEPEAPVAAVLRAVEDELGRSRVISSTLRADQPSSFMLAEEIEQNRVMALFLPAVILAISSSSLFIALSRLVTSQRREIGLEKALGYSDRQILGQYLSFALIVAGCGAALGFVLGDALARVIAEQYVAMLGVPFLEHHVYPQIAAGAAGISTVACVLSGIVPAWRSSRLPPAQAMYADPNAALTGGHVPLLEKVLSPVLPQAFVLRIPLRNLFRQKRRSFYTLVGVAFAMLLAVTTQSMFDAMDDMLDRFDDVSERWDVQAVFAEPFGSGRAIEVAHWSGVRRVQAALILPAELRTDRAVHQGTLTCTEPAADFHGFRILEGPTALEALSAGGLVITGTLADKLGIGVGDLARVKTPYRDQWVDLPVAAISQETLGAPIFANLDTARRLTGFSGLFNALYVNTTPAAATDIKDRLGDTEGVLSVMVKAEMLARFVEMMGFMDFYQGLLLAFGLAMAFVVVYNTLNANVVERTREIGTMRTIGEGTGRIAWMITIENLLLGVAAAPLGVWLGLRTADLLYAQLSSEAFTLTAYIKPSSVAVILVWLLVVMLLSEIPPILRILRLNLAEATKVLE